MINSILVVTELKAEDEWKVINNFFEKEIKEKSYWEIGKSSTLIQDKKNGMETIQSAISSIKLYQQ